MATTDATEGRSIGGLARRANPAFAGVVVVVPVAAFAGVLAGGDLRVLTYVHVMSGVLWAGIGLFVGLVLGPVLGGLDVEERAAVFRWFTPKMTFPRPNRSGRSGSATPNSGDCRGYSSRVSSP